MTDEAPFKAGDRVTLRMNDLSPKRSPGVVRSCSWNGEDSDAGWWVEVLLDDDPGPDRTLYDRPRTPGDRRRICVMASECKSEPEGSWAP